MWKGWASSAEQRRRRKGSNLLCLLHYPWMKSKHIRGLGGCTLAWDTMGECGQTLCSAWIHRSGFPTSFTWLLTGLWKSSSLLCYCHYYVIVIIIFTIFKPCLSIINRAANRPLKYWTVPYLTVKWLNGCATLTFFMQQTGFKTEAPTQNRNASMHSVLIYVSRQASCKQVAIRSLCPVTLHF